MVTFVGLAMAEVCSSYPTAGGLYYWSAKLAKKNGPAWAWFTGWFNLLGQVAITAGIDFGLSAFVCAFMGIAFDVEVTKVILIGTYTVVLAVHGLLNTFGVRLVAIFNNISVWWHVAGVAIVVAMCIILPDSHTSLGTIFSFSQEPSSAGQVPGFINLTGFTKSPIPILGITAYVFLIGLLLTQYTLTGYDASAHMTEETHEADVSGPNGIWKSIVISVFFGYILLLGGLVRDAGSGGLRRGSGVPVPGDGEHRGSGRDLPRLVRQELGDLRVDHRDGRAVLLRYGLHHDQLAHDLRVLTRRRGPRSPVVALDQQADPHPNERDLAGRRAGLVAGRTGVLAGVDRRLLRGDGRRCHRPLHRLRDPDLPAAPSGRRIPGRTVEAGQVEPARSGGSR